MHEKKKFLFITALTSIAQTRFCNVTFHVSINNAGSGLLYRKIARAPISNKKNKKDWQKQLQFFKRYITATLSLSLCNAKLMFIDVVVTRLALFQLKSHVRRAACVDTVAFAIRK